MKRAHHSIVVRKLIMLGGGLTLLLAFPLAFADRAFANPTPKFAYVANENNCNSPVCSAGNVSAYTIDSSTGALRAVAGSPFAAGIEPYSVTVDPSGQFAYVANAGDDTVSAYTINSSTGALRAVAGSPFAAGIEPHSVTVDPSGRFAYVANYCFPCSQGNVSAYTINRSTGALRAVSGSPFADGPGPNSVTVDPSGRFVYVTNYCDGCSAGNVSAYTINNSTGALRAVSGSPFAAGNNPNSVTVDPSGRFAYVANACDSSPDCSAGDVSAYTINSSTGALSAVAGSPFAAGTNPISVAIAGQAHTTSVLTLTPRSLAFGNLPIHTSSAAQSVTVTNTSAKAVAIASIALRGTAPGQFAFTDDCGKSLAAYRTCALEAIFRPTTEGAKTAYLDVNGGAGAVR